MAEPDELYTLRNRFWLGNFNMAIAEGNNLIRIPDDLKVERDEFVYRCYLGLGQYKTVISGVKDDAPTSLRAVKLLAQYMAAPDATRDATLRGIDTLLNENTTSGIRTVELVAALIYDREGMMNEAFKAIRSRGSMEQMALYAQLCLKVNRPDLAEKQLKALMDLDEDATLTQLVSAWVNMAIGGKKLKEAAYAYEELIDKFEPSLPLLNGIACCNMLMHDWAEAESHLLTALQKGSNDPDTLCNLIACYHQMGKPAEIVDRYSNQLVETAPNHPFVLKLKRAEAQFDRVAQQMATAAD